MTLNDLEEAVKLLSERHVATIYAHNADDFVRVMIGSMNRTIYSRSIPPGAAFAPSVAGISVFSQQFLLPGTALLIDQFGQIMQVCRYEAQTQNDGNDEGEIGDVKL